jgi:hypothetical protein
VAVLTPDDDTQGSLGGGVHVFSFFGCGRRVVARAGMVT